MINKKLVILYLRRNPEATQSDAGRQFGVSRERIRQIVTAAGIVGSDRWRKKLAARRLRKVAEWVPPDGTPLRLAWEAANAAGLRCSPVQVVGTPRFSTRKLIIGKSRVSVHGAANTSRPSPRMVTPYTHFGCLLDSRDQFLILVQLFEYEHRIYVVPANAFGRSIYIPHSFRETPYNNAKGFPWQQYRDAWHLLK